MEVILGSCVVTAILFGIFYLAYRINKTNLFSGFMLCLALSAPGITFFLLAMQYPGNFFLLYPVVTLVIITIIVLLFLVFLYCLRSCLSILEPSSEKKDDQLPTNKKLKPRLSHPLSCQADKGSMSRVPRLKQWHNSPEMRAGIFTAAAGLPYYLLRSLI